MSGLSSSTNSLVVARMPRLLARAKPRLPPASISRTLGPSFARPSRGVPSCEPLSTTTTVGGKRSVCPTTMAQARVELVAHVVADDHDRQRSRVRHQRPLRRAPACGSAVRAPVNNARARRGVLHDARARQSVVSSSSRRRAELIGRGEIVSTYRAAGTVDFARNRRVERRPAGRRRRALRAASIQSLRMSTETQRPTRVRYKSRSVSSSTYERKRTRSAMS